jgi:hypothetical protein
MIKYLLTLKRSKLKNEKMNLKRLNKMNCIINEINWATKNKQWNFDSYFNLIIMRSFEESHGTFEYLVSKTDNVKSLSQNASNIYLSASSS